MKKWLGLFVIGTVIFINCRINELPGFIGTPKASFSLIPNKPEFTIDEEIGFENTSIGANFEWNFGSEALPVNTSTLKDPGKISYSNPGEKRIRLKVYFQSLTAFDTISQSIKIIEKPISYPIPNFSISPDSCIVPCKVFFKNISTGAKQFQWNFGNGKTSTEISPLPVIYESAGIFTIKLTAIADNNAFKDTQKYLRVYPSPSIFGNYESTFSGSSFNNISFASSVEVNDSILNVLFWDGNSYKTSIINPQKMSFTSPVIKVSTNSQFPLYSFIGSKFFYIVEYAKTFELVHHQIKVFNKDLEYLDSYKPIPNSYNIVTDIIEKTTAELIVVGYSFTNSSDKTSFIIQDNQQSSSKDYYPLRLVENLIGGILYLNDKLGPYCPEADTCKNLKNITIVNPTSINGRNLNFNFKSNRFTSLKRIQNQYFILNTLSTESSEIVEFNTTSGEIVKRNSNINFNILASMSSKNSELILCGTKQNKIVICKIDIGDPGLIYKWYYEYGFSSADKYENISIIEAKSGGFILTAIQNSKGINMLYLLKVNSQGKLV